MNDTDFTEAFERKLDEYGHIGGNYDRIESRSCSSDEYSGVEYTFYGDYIPIRPIIGLVAKKDGYAIPHMSHATDGEEPNLTVFVADISREQRHPAFIGPASSP